LAFSHSRRATGRSGLGARGVAAVEFGLILPVFVTLLIGCLDFGLAYLADAQLAAAVSAGAQYAFTQGQTESGSTLTSDVSSFVTAVSQVSLSALTVTNNNGLSATSCYCVTGATPTYTGPVSCGSTCTDGSTAGKFVAISASFTYTPIFPADKVFFSTAKTQTITVRLQ
jgi:Flp pilus assembly protein TadG